MIVLIKTFNFFVPFLLGFCASLVKLFRKGDEQVLVKFVFYIGLPATLFLSCYKANWAIFGTNYLMSYLISGIFTFLLSLIVNSLILRDKVINGTMLGLVTTQVGVGLFTVPLFNLIFKSAAMAMPLMVCQSIIFLTFSIILLELQSGKPDKKGIFNLIVKRFMRSIFYNPVILFAILGLCLNLLKFKLPIYLLGGIEFISQPLSALALFCLGLSSGFNLRILGAGFKDWRLFCQLLIKLFIFPAIAYLIGKWMSLTLIQLESLVLFAASPTAAHTYAISKRYGEKSEFTSIAIVVSTIASYFTVALWIYLI